MKKRSLALFAVAILILPSFSLLPRPALAAGWAEVDSPTSEILFSMGKYNDARIAVGGNGAVALSDDGGESWEDGESGTSYDLYGISLLNENDAVAVGQNAEIIRTEDGGETWEDADVDGLTSTQRSYAFRAVHMVTTSVGWAVGAYGMMVKTTDGGENWEVIDSPTDEGLNHVDAVSSSIVWVVGENGVIYKSSNGGTSWTAQSSGTSVDLSCIEMYSSSIGYACGDDETLLVTDDGGSDWDQQDVDGLESGEFIIDVSFRTADDGILTGSEGTLLETDDGGDNWTEVEENVSGVVLDLVNVSASEWWGVGDGGIIVRYDDSSPNAPENFDVSGSNDNVTDTTPRFTWEASDDDETDIDYYEFKMDSGSYRNIGNVTSKTYSTELDDGRHTAYVRSVDSAGNTSGSSSVTFTIDTDSDSSSTSSSDVDIARITPTRALRNQTVTFNAMIEDDDGSIDECDLYVDGEAEKGMTVKTDVVYTTYRFTSTGTHTMYARCTDDNGEIASGTSVTVTVVSQSEDADPGDIIKIGCTGDVYVNDPCTAVYYYGYDGRRHAFPNETVFKSWFNNFDNLVILTSSAMADLSLGENVTYKPGEEMVQFSDSTVYAVSFAGILRPIADGTIARALYGSDWTDDIVGINDVFFGNYRIGSTIDSSADYSASTVRNFSSTIDSTF